jgi:predicted signal transduction protein with EAL and GGDEF domain
MSKAPPAIAPTAGYLTGRDRLVTVIRYTAVVGVAAHLLFIPLFLWLNAWQMAAVNLLGSAILAFCFWLNRRGHPHAALLIGAIEVITIAVLAVVFVGWASGFHYYILLLTPLIFYSPKWRAAYKIALVVILCAAYITLGYYSIAARPWVQADPLRLDATRVLNIITMFVILAMLAYYYRLAATEAELALIRANRSLEQLAHSDPLTRLSNRRDMQANIGSALAAYQAGGAPFSVVMCDIDDFKKINDRYGHEAGDSILVAVASLMRGGLRAQD